MARATLHTVQDDEMPAGHDWLALSLDGSVHVVVRSSRLTVETVTEAFWGGAMLALEPCGV